MENFTRDFSCGDMLDNGQNALEYKNPSYSGIWQSFNEMRESNKFCDVILRSGDGQCFPAHQAILAANSIYFFKTFIVPDKCNSEGSSHNLTQTLHIELSQMSGEDLTCILDYMYTRVLRVTMDNVFKLLEYADKFKINGLACHCRKFLERALNNCNCFMIWRFAKSHNQKKILKDTRKYILHNFLNIAERNPDFLKLTSNEVLEFVLDDYLNVKTEESVFESAIHWVGHDPASRKSHLPSFLSAMRLGLVKMQYLIDNIGNHTYVQGDLSCKPFLDVAIDFLCDLQKNGCNKVSLLNPLVRPRVPTDVLFTFGGWCGSSPICQFETYDTRADRWFNHPAMQEDIPRAYYGLAVVARNIYIIGGYNGHKYFNTNRKFDPVRKQWTDLSHMYTKVFFLLFIMFPYTDIVNHHSRILDLDCFHLKFEKVMAELQNPPDGNRNMAILCEIKLIKYLEYKVMNINYKLTKGDYSWSTRSTKSTT